MSGSISGAKVRSQWQHRNCYSDKQSGKLSRFQSYFLLTWISQIADWVAESILSKDDSRRRAATIKQFISVADVRFWQPTQQSTLTNFWRSDVVSCTTSPQWSRLHQGWTRPLSVGLNEHGSRLMPSSWPSWEPVKWRSTRTKTSTPIDQPLLPYHPLVFLSLASVP